MHIVTEIVFDMAGGSSIYVADVIESMRKRGQQLLDEALKAVKDRGLEADSLLVESIGGRVATQIIERATQVHADLIVMGTHGRSGLRRLMLGSDAEEVVRLAPVPVLLVRGDARVSAELPVHVARVANF